jgi:bis(5'-nucleosyl)-tetraphosphatase (symmetrical)
MSRYAIGDVQGCYTELRLLLDKLTFDPATDRVWFTGDLVNRGDHSLETLRYVRSLGDAAVTVLGNHDLHLLAVAAGVARTKSKDTLAPILDAPDRDELLDWLRTRPLLYREDDFLLVHAGLIPQWTGDDALTYAAEVETWLRGEDYRELLQNMYGDYPDIWTDSLTAWPRLRFITNCCTRMRYCDRVGRLDLKHKGSPGQQPARLMPWFEIKRRKTRDLHVIFGHWSTLGAYSGDGVTCLDSGCLWGGQLSAFNLDDRSTWTQVECMGIPVGLDE